eukprot:TRINITY_DN26185_c0_g2_i1.p1 TRINITY_DN26185_c0_g2~~TRINITY_DN26185_c0_g2_i1.p1  ORF type:complete len:133 (+),score=34.66 TRINITY_DN26185_c0_g2_i1:205-603(+)
MSGCAHGGIDPKCSKCDGKCKVVASMSNDQLEWLADMASQFSLPDSGKALRCCINWAAQEADAGGSQDAVPGAEETARMEFALAPNQLEWLEAKAAGGDVGTVLGSVLSMAMTIEPPSRIFEVIRCKTNTSA